MCGLEGREVEQQDEETDEVSSSTAQGAGCLTGTRAAGDLRPLMVAKGEGTRRGGEEEERWDGQWVVLVLVGGRRVLVARGPIALNPFFLF